MATRLADPDRLGRALVLDELFDVVILAAAVAITYVIGLAARRLLGIAVP